MQRYRAVYLHERSPFWEGIFITTLVVPITKKGTHPFSYTMYLTDQEYN